MNKIIRALLISIVSTAAALAAVAPHDLYVCATLNRNYIVGAKYVTASGVFQREESGWHHLGVNDPSILAAAFDPRDRDVFYAVMINGCLRTLDGGKTWRTTTGWEMTEPKDVGVDPNAPDTVYLALPDGVAASTDRAQTWTRRENGLPARGKYTQTIEVDRTRAGRVLAGCEQGVYLTEDAAKTWRRVLPTQATVDDIQQSPHDPKFWLAVTQSDGAWASHDGGLTWTKLETVPSAAALYNIAFDPTNARRLAIGSWTYGVLLSEDGGATWTSRNAGLPEGHHVWRVAIDPDNGRLYAGVLHEALYSSTDFGRTWTRDGLEGSRINSFAFIPRAAK